MLTNILCKGDKTLTSCGVGVSALIPLCREVFEMSMAKFLSCLSDSKLI